MIILEMASLSEMLKPIWVGLTERVQSRRMERIARREATEKIKESRKAAAEAEN